MQAKEALLQWEKYFWFRHVRDFIFKQQVYDLKKHKDQQFV